MVKDELAMEREKMPRKRQNCKPFGYLRLLLGKLVSTPFQWLIERENSIKIFQFIALRLFCASSTEKTKKNQEKNAIQEEGKAAIAYRNKCNK